VVAPRMGARHVDQSSLHPLIGLWRRTFGAADGQPDLGLTPDLGVRTAPSTASNAGPCEERGLHTRSRNLVPTFRLRGGPPTPVSFIWSYTKMVVRLIDDDFNIEPIFIHIP
jgi:hypothetical protein